MSLRGIGKSFGATAALSDVDIELREGEVLGLAGHNGAGKSTLIKILTGAVRADVGQIIFDGDLVEIPNRAAAERLGISVVDQDERLFPNVSIVENIWAGSAYPRRMLGRIDWSAIRKSIEEANARLDLSVPLSSETAALSVMQARLVEISRALLRHRRVVIFDEATAALDAQELSRFYRILNRLRGEHTAVVVVSHDLKELLRNCDRVTVLRDGHVVADERVEQLKFEDLFELVSGIPYHQVGPTTVGKNSVVSGAMSAPVLVTKGLTGRTVRGATFSVSAGEIVGMTGLSGSGWEEVIEMLGGATRLRAGSIELSGRSIKGGSVRKARRAGLAMLSRNRGEFGLFRGMSLCDNLAVGNLRPYRLGSWLPLLRYGTIRGAAQRAVDAFKIQTTSVNANVDSLSGGNQQKVLVARIALTGALALVLDEPNEGVDVGTQRDIRAMINDLADQGVAIIIGSTDANELIQICNRLLVFRKGCLAGELNGVFDEGDVLRVVHGDRDGIDQGPGLARSSSRTTATPSSNS